ncbi:MAG TPA: 5-(carboxyamino)imidazole ribonucleotide mutase [Bacteriovoracaceae bacterium]|nr:5-(carboxyamino)imidazole ribonucleotide mutase [Bacteriovoracaceae bacterium]
MNARIAIVMGSDSDWKIMRPAKDVLTQFEEFPHLQVVSAHRTPEDLRTFVEWAEGHGIKAIIAGAGGAAHLPGMLAAYTVLPVIGVPINATALNGMDSLLSIVQMPKGIPVATVAVDNSTNAALLALRILAVSDPKLRAMLERYREDMKTESRKKTANLI